MIKEDINKIFDNCYTKGVGHTIFQRQKALNEIISYLKKQDIVCPFCGDDDFDKIGLKYHLRTYCKVYQDTEEL